MPVTPERLTALSAAIARELQGRGQAEQRNSLVDRDTALWLLTDRSLSSGEVLAVAELPRRFYHGNRVLVHILNNIRNGNCAEDCGYCAQRKSAVGVPVYSMKPEDEILREAQAAKENGAHRYCLVTAGRSTSQRMASVYADLVRKIKADIGIRVCLSAGMIDDPEAARILADAGLDRYNHNLNTSESNYGSICSTHSYLDRLKTLELVSARGIGLCSGIIAGMGEDREDLVTVAFELNRLGAASIPVNFFLPVDGHAIDEFESLSADDCLRILSVFRLVNPTAEVRMAAGREIYLGDLQSEGLRVANSLFVSGYLNVKGSSAEQSMRLIYENGYRLDDECENDVMALRDQILAESSGPADPAVEPTEEKAAPSPMMKSLGDLRPLRRG